MSTSTPPPLPFAYQFLAGAIAGVTEISCLYPLDVVKTRFQLQITAPAAPAIAQIASSAAAVTSKTATQVVASQNYTSIVDCLRKIIQQEGVGTLYRGVIPPILAEAPKRAVKFGANEQWGLALKKLFSIDRFNMAQAGFVGSLAGATEAFLVTPTDLIKVRMQSRDNAGLYTGTIDCIRKVTAQEGLLAFYNGLEATIWRHASWSGIYFGFIHTFRTAFPERPGTAKNEVMMRNFIAGTIGGTLGTMVNTPFDVVKSRLQAQSSSVARYGWTLPAIATIYKEEGFRALYKGLAPKAARLGPGGGLLLLVFDRVSEVMRKHLGDQAKV